MNLKIVQKKAKKEPRSMTRKELVQEILRRIEAYKRNK